MKFEVKRDSSFMSGVLIMAGTAVVMISAPFIYLFQVLSYIYILLWLFLLLITVGGILCMSFGVNYKFLKHDLHVKGGIFRSHIPYHQITEVKSLRFRITDLSTGYLLLGSRDGIEVFYDQGTEVVKISPAQKGLFLSEFKKRCPQAEFTYDE